MGALTLDNVTKIFSESSEDIVAVDNVNLNIKDGEFIVLVGPSGSGKSTTMRLVAGLESVTEGSIYLDDVDITDQSPGTRDTAMVFQNYALYPHLDVRGNMSFGLKMQGELSAEEINERVEEAAEMLGIDDYLTHKPSELSGGQKQRVALGRAIVRNPAVFLMDEPLSNLDAKLRTKMRTEIQQLQSQLDVTTIYVTHDQVEAMTMGDRIAIMNHGEIQQVATPLEAYNRPANQFVAGFIGSPSMNFIDVTASRSRDGLILNHPEFEYTCTDVLAGELPEDKTEFVLGIRPEDIAIVDAEMENSVPIDVEVVEPLGKEQLVYFELASSSYTANISGDQRVTENERVHIIFPEDRIHIFDSETGETIKNRELSEELIEISRV
ncbi:ABC transporter ATP-binding protein [Haloferax sp. YSMS24]|uniref:ABC transporter ATP-binding protein n=1 Tax=Haloferax sp. YSMS24 TaxID=3388425 RepID=UPI00398C99F5